MTKAQKFESVKPMLQNAGLWKPQFIDCVVEGVSIMPITFGVKKFTDIQHALLVGFGFVYESDMEWYILYC